MWWALMSLAWAGYGDPFEGTPSHAERELHVWTNAIRVAPKAFAEDYLLGGCRFDDFKASEQKSKDPLAWSAALNLAARGHTLDMYDNNFVGHTSSDGTDFFTRVSRYYPGAVGENVAGGQPSPFSAVAHSWMCSTGHRANIMEDWTEFGGGVASVYYTQNFGAGATPDRVMSMGVHTPEVPQGGNVTYLVDVSTPVRADAVSVLVNGVPHDMDVEIGRRRNGIFVGRVPYEAGCQVYWFEAEVEGVLHRFPEDGAYGFGDCAFDDAEAQWMGAETLSGPDSPVPFFDTPGSSGRGCATTPAPLSGLAWFGLWGALMARRREAR